MPNTDELHGPLCVNLRPLYWFADRTRQWLHETQPRWRGWSGWFVRPVVFVVILSPVAVMVVMIACFFHNRTANRVWSKFKLSLLLLLLLLLVLLLLVCR